MAKGGIVTKLAPILRWLLRFGVVTLLVSLFWVLSLRFVLQPDATLLMGLRAQSGVTVTQYWSPIEDISPHLVRAVIAAEDTKFCTHHGFDVEQIREAMAEAEAGGRLRGASTLSQQTAKNVFLWNGGGFFRKGIEAWFTLLIETLWPKERILEIYLNVAEWGDGHFGAEAAARHYFGKSADQLTAREASLLAAVLPNPNKWRVDRPGPYVMSRSQTLRRRMALVREQGLAACILTSDDAK